MHNGRKIEARIENSGVCGAEYHYYCIELTVKWILGGWIKGKSARERELQDFNQIFLHIFIYMFCVFACELEIKINCAIDAIIAVFYCYIIIFN